MTNSAAIDKHLKSNFQTIVHYINENEFFIFPKKTILHYLLTVTPDENSQKNSDCKFLETTKKILN